MGEVADLKKPKGPLTVLSVDLAHSSYQNNGLVALTAVGESIEADLLTIPLHGSPDPAALASFLATIATQRGARLIFLDGPQGWRDPSRDVSELRVCERKLAAPAKTGLPENVKPATYKPFVVFCIHVFDELQARGWSRLDSPEDINSTPVRIAVESFPLAAWRTLKIPSLPAKKKARPNDIHARLEDLQRFVSIKTSRDPSHDELQAIVGGLAGFPDHFEVRAEGVAPSLIGGYWREGFIISPRAKLPVRDRSSIP